MSSDQKGFLTPEFLREIEAANRNYISKYLAPWALKVTTDYVTNINSRALMKPTTIGTLMDEYLGFESGLKALEDKGITRHDPTARPIVEAKEATAKAIFRQIERRYGLNPPAFFRHKGVTYGRDHSYSRPAIKPIDIPEVSSFEVL